MKVTATDDVSHAVKVTLDGDNAVVSAGGSGSSGEIVLVDRTGASKVRVHTGTSDGHSGAVQQGTVNEVHTTPSFTLWTAPAENITLDAEAGLAVIGGKTHAGSIYVTDQDGTATLRLGGTDSTISLSDNTGRLRLLADGHAGALSLKSASGDDRVVLDATAASGSFGGHQADGRVTLLNKSGATTIDIDGGKGDILFGNADCAEDFDVAMPCREASIEPGMVVVLDDQGAVRPCTEEYDGRVAGVVSGAGDYRPALVLDRRPSVTPRLPVALMGKVSCRVDARFGSIRPGDLLTTSPTAGHAMKATDRARAFGAVLGKALAPLAGGQGLIPILVVLK